jgi:hypothetical protein
MLGRDFWPSVFGLLALTKLTPNRMGNEVFRDAHH